MFPSRLYGALPRVLITAVLLTLIAAFAFAAHAQAGELVRHHHRHHHHVHHHRHHARRWHRYRHFSLERFSEQIGAQEPRGMLEMFAPPTRMAGARIEQVRVYSADVLREAARFVGRGNPTGFRGPWCAAFVRFILQRTGHHPVRSLRAIDQLGDGYRVARPRPGDIAVMRSHVTFFAGWGGRGFYGLGGNQGRHRVTESSYPIWRVIAFVRPA